MILESCCAATLAGERQARHITIDTLWRHRDGPFKNVPVKDFSVAQSLQPLDGVRIDVGRKHLAKVDTEQTSCHNWCIQPSTVACKNLLSTPKILFPQRWPVSLGHDTFHVPALHPLRIHGKMTLALIPNKPRYQSLNP